MRVVSVVLRSASSAAILVVEQNSSAYGLISSLPGGKVECNESDAAALAREVLEETGLVVADEPALAYSIGTEGALPRRIKVFTSTIEEHEPTARDVGSVLAATWLSPRDALSLFETAAVVHIREPLMAYLAGQSASAEWLYRQPRDHTPQEAIELLDHFGAIVRGHFDVHGTHTDRLAVPAALLEAPDALELVAWQLASFVEPYEPEVLVAPAVGGVPFGVLAATRLGVPLNILDAHPRNTEFTASRGASLRDRTVAIIDSSCHSSATLAATERAVIEQGGVVTAAAVGISTVSEVARTNSPVAFPMHCFASIAVGAWRSDCPLCEDDVPLERPPARWRRTVP